MRKSFRNILKLLLAANVCDIDRWSITMVEKFSNKNTLYNTALMFLIFESHKKGYFNIVHRNNKNINIYQKINI